MSEGEKRYQIYESSKIIDAYIVIDTHLNKEHRFHNIASARKWIRDEKSKPLLNVQYKFERLGKTTIACRVQDDLGGEKIYTEVISVK